MSRSQAAVTSQLRSLVSPVLGPDVDLEDITMSLAGRRRLVRVIVDRDGGLSLDDVAEVSTAISEVLDATDALGDAPYVLEVSSPGVDRPLHEPRHWRRATGRLVTVHVAGRGLLTARITDADETGVVLVPDGADAAADSGADEAGSRVPYSALGPGAVQVEFSRPASDTHGEDIDGEDIDGDADRGDIPDPAEGAGRR